MVTHGAVLCTVEAAGPELPAEAATKMPADAAARARHEEIERWGDEVLQMVPRRIMRWGTVHHPELRRWISAQSGVPAPGVAARLSVVPAWYYARVVSADEATVRGWLREDLLRLVDPSMDRAVASSRVEGRPAVVLVVGVNGTGKTTTVGKLARVLVAEDKDVVLGAADTFRAAAADQLETWGARVGVPTVRSDRDGADPAAVAFDAVKAGAEMEADVVIVDDRIGRVVDALRIGRHSMAIARQSVLAGIGLSIAGMAAAALGYLPPVQGALMQEAIDVAVILNALRALRIPNPAAEKTLTSTRQTGNS